MISLVLGDLILESLTPSVNGPFISVSGNEDFLVCSQNKNKT